MDKIICDICGTSYPASATQCPICGCEKPADPVVDEETVVDSESAGTYKPVKGGRFSNANVRKRNKVAAVPVKSSYEPDDEDEEDEDEPEEEERSNKGLVVVLVLLILAILALVLYLYFNFFAPVNEAPKDTEPVNTTTAAATTESIETEPPTVPCAELEVSDTEIVLDAIGNAWLLNVVASPADTTDSITYVSSDENVATVTSEGCVTAVGPGQAVITVTCGDVVVECNVSCNIETEPVTEPTVETTVATEPAAVWSLNRQDITMRVGEVWPLYEGEVSTAQITFSSNDNSVATFKKGNVTAVGEGYTVVSAEYNGVKYECIIRVKAAVTETQPAETTAPPASDSGSEVG